MDKSKTMDTAMEPQIARKIDTMRCLHHHHNILHISKVMATRTKIYLIVDFAYGDELFSKLFQQLVFVLCFCHRNNIEHHDLRLQNLLLDIASNLKVFDFGDFALLEQLKNGLHTT